MLGWSWHLGQWGTGQDNDNEREVWGTVEDQRNGGGGIKNRGTKYGVISKRIATVRKALC